MKKAAVDMVAVDSVPVAVAGKHLAGGMVVTTQQTRGWYRRASNPGGKSYCAVVLDVFVAGSFGWSINNSASSSPPRRFAPSQDVRMTE